jgi:hypothetical protein
MNKLVLVIMTAMAASCGGGESAEEGGACASRSGSYATRYTQASGTCGPIAEVVGAITGQPAEPGGECLGHIDYSADGCVATTVARCVESQLGAGFESTIDGRVEWDSSGSSATGSMEKTVFKPDGAVHCRSSYAIAISRRP